VQRSKQQATREGGRLAAPESLQQAVHRHRLQSDLLQEAKGKVSSKALRLNEVSWYSMECSEQEAGDPDSQHEEQKYRSRAQHGSFQVISSPSKRFWSVAMQGKAEHEPYGKHEP